jgi:hypothetical protein
MPTLQWWPQKPNDLLQVDGELLEAGDTFDVDQEAADELLNNPEIRVHTKDPSHSRSGIASQGESKGSRKSNETGDADAS